MRACVQSYEGDLREGEATSGDGGVAKCKGKGKGKTLLGRGLELGW